MPVIEYSLHFRGRQIHVGRAAFQEEKFSLGRSPGAVIDIAGMSIGHSAQLPARTRQALEIIGRKHLMINIEGEHHVTNNGSARVRVNTEELRPASNSTAIRTRKPLSLGQGITISFPDTEKERGKLRAKLLGPKTTPGLIIRLKLAK